MVLMSLRNRSYVKASMVLTRADHLFIHTYIRSLLNIICRPILMVRSKHELASYCLGECRLSQLSHTGSCIYKQYYLYHLSYNVQYIFSEDF